MRTILFDFDGTLADTLDETIIVFNELCGEFGHKKINLKDKEVWRNKSSLKVVRDLGISIFKLSYFIKKAREKLGERIEKIKPAKNLRPVLVKLNKNNALAILSSNSEENIRKFLQVNRLDFFKHIFPNSSTFGKARFMKKIVRKLKLNGQELVYICDETRDVEAARKAGLKTIAVTWGFNSRQALEKARPDFIADSPIELFRILTKH